MAYLDLQICPRAVHPARRLPRGVFAALLAFLGVIGLGDWFTLARGNDLPWIKLSPDGKQLISEDSGRPWKAWGFNYDHDSQGRLIEDYWTDEWPRVEGDLAEMRQLGANVARVHLQFGKFMQDARTPNQAALDQLAKLVREAERLRLYLDLTGLGCYHKKDVPAWYDTLSESERWDAQARFWQSIAKTVAQSPAVFCFDLMNEPVVPGGRRQDADWLGPPFGDKHFVQCITLDQKERPRPEIACKWIDHLSAAIRQVDRRHLITVGLVDWSLDRPGLTSGFVPKTIAPHVDFLCVHIYPEKGEINKALETLRGFAVGKPVIVEETFPLRCSTAELVEFIDKSRDLSSGWLSFYWGSTPQELRGSPEIADAMMLDWLQAFERRAKLIGQ